MRVNRKRFMDNFRSIGEIGIEEGSGITRLLFSKEYHTALDMFEKLMLEAGLGVYRDKVGNIFGKRPGKISGAPSILIGSHLDTVKNGGLYDGNYGVIAALEAVNILNDNNIETDHPIEVVGFNAEEGSELGGTFGSRVMVGRQDIESPGIEEKLALYDLTIDDIKDSIRSEDEFLAFLEIHVEQGKYLETNNLNIGIVDGIVGISRYLIRVKGEANHAGTTSMDLRKDALVAASKIIVYIDKIARSYPNLVATVGKIDAFPNATTIIPGKVEFWIELRDLNQDNIEGAMDKIKEFGNSLDDFELEYEFSISKPSKMTNVNINRIIEEICKKSGAKYTIMPSGAGHDAKEVVYKVPTSLIFVPSKDGISHSPYEYTKEEDLVAGIELLTKTIIEVDKKF